MDLAIIFAGLFVLLLLGTTLYLLLRRNPLQARVEELIEERSRLNASLEHSRQSLAEEQARARQSLAEAEERGRSALAQAEERARLALASEQQRLQQQIAEQKQWIAEQTRHFESGVLGAAAKLMEERGKAFTELNQKEVQTVVAPFKEQLAEFRQRVDHIYAEDAKERGSLKAQIEQLTTMNQAMSLQAERLVNALTITSKSVGDWGETILEKILEDSGLRRGHEYELQLVVKDADDRVQRPDAVIRLPEARHLVIDSKVSNKAWTEYCSAADEEQRTLKLREHLASLRGHIKELAARRYSDIPELTTVDFVLMFVPVEAALLTAFVKDPSLYADAYRSRIVLVTPSTLMAVVKLVEGIWTFQKRKESADELFELGRKLYEKLVGFAATFELVGDAIDKAAAAHGKAMGQLRDGRGSAIQLAENMKALGVTPGPGKQMPPELLQQPLDDAAQDLPRP